MTQFFVDPDGNYLGGFDGAEPPAGSVEVPDPPIHGGQIWDGNAWQTPADVQDQLTDDLRRQEYPDIGDQLDAIWKQLNQDRMGGEALIQEADDRLNEILAVKQKHPKG